MVSSELIPVPFLFIGHSLKNFVKEPLYCVLFLPDNTRIEVFHDTHSDQNLEELVAAKEFLWVVELAFFLTFVLINKHKQMLNLIRFQIMILQVELLKILTEKIC